MLYLELCKLLKMQILTNINIKDMAYVLMEEKHLLTYEKEAILMILNGSKRNNFWSRYEF